MNTQQPTPQRRRPAAGTAGQAGLNWPARPRRALANPDAALKRNPAFTAASSHHRAVIFPNLSRLVITCLDPRVDPAHLLGLGPSDALVIRNIGGPITPEMINKIALIGQLAENLLPAIEEIWPRADRQHCAVHRLRNLQAKLPKSEHDRIRFNYWAALTDATSDKDGKLRLQALISELEHGGYESAARCLADDLDARSCTCATRSDTANRGDQPTSSNARSGRCAGAPKRWAGSRRDQLPVTGLGGARPVLQPRLKRRDVHRRRPPTPLPNQYQQADPDTLDEEVTAGFPIGERTLGL